MPQSSLASPSHTIAAYGQSVVNLVIHFLFARSIPFQHLRHCQPVTKDDDTLALSLLSVGWNLVSLLRRLSLAQTLLSTIANGQ